MRINLKTSPNKTLIPFNYQKNLVGTLHKWMGYNDYHDLISLYSFSWLHNAVSKCNGFDFPEGSKWFISFYDDSILKRIISSILKDPMMFYGMEVEDVSIENTPDLSSRDLFYLASPIFIKQYVADDGKIKHYTFDDSVSGELMKDTLLHKMKVAGLPIDESLKIYFDQNYVNKKIKYIDYRGVRNKANMCTIYIKGKPETKAFAWNVGIGNSTGIGFGAIY